MSWRLLIARRALRDLEDLPSRDRDLIRGRLSDLVVDPSAADLAKLQGEQGLWRLRVGRWRAILELDSGSGTITVVRVLARKDAYRD